MTSELCLMMGSASAKLVIWLAFSSYSDEGGSAARSLREPKSSAADRAQPHYILARECYYLK